MPIHALPTLPSKTEVLVDANVLVYGLLRRSAQSEDLLARCGRKELYGFITVESLGDACHKMMVSEAAGKGLTGRANASSLQGKSGVIKLLNTYWQLARSAAAQSLAVLPYDEYRFTRAHGLRTAHGLMINDSVLLAAADLFGIPSLATNDDDFDPVPWLDVYKPTDLARAAP